MEVFAGDDEAALDLKYEAVEVTENLVDSDGSNSIRAMLRKTKGVFIKDYNVEEHLEREVETFTLFGRQNIIKKVTSFIKA